MIFHLENCLLCLWLCLRQSEIERKIQWPTVGAPWLPSFVNSNTCQGIQVSAKVILSSSCNVATLKHCAVYGRCQCFVLNSAKPVFDSGILYFCQNRAHISAQQLTDYKMPASHIYPLWTDVIVFSFVLVDWMWGLLCPLSFSNSLISGAAALNNDFITCSPNHLNFTVGG